MKKITSPSLEVQIRVWFEGRESLVELMIAGTLQFKKMVAIGKEKQDGSTSFASETKKNSPSPIELML